MNFPNPHYINENQSDIRGIKDGWYAMEADGRLSAGPFPSREDCMNRLEPPAKWGPIPFGLWQPPQ
jgi:hypothetical protein